MRAEIGRRLKALERLFRNRLAAKQYPPFVVGLRGGEAAWIGAVRGGDAFSWSANTNGDILMPPFMLELVQKHAPNLRRVRPPPSRVGKQDSVRNEVLPIMANIRHVRRSGFGDRRPAADWH